MIAKCPESLHQVVQRPADRIAEYFSGQPFPMETGIAERKHAIPDPEIDRAAHHILKETNGVGSIDLILHGHPLHKALPELSPPNPTRRTQAYRPPRHGST